MLIWVEPSILTLPFTSKASALDLCKVNFSFISDVPDIFVLPVFESTVKVLVVPSVIFKSLLIWVEPSILTLPFTSKASALLFSSVSFSFILVVPSISVLPVVESTVNVIAVPSSITKLSDIVVVELIWTVSSTLRVPCMFVFPVSDETLNLDKSLNVIWLPMLGWAPHW